MNPGGLSGITFQQLEIFLCAAKHENFTRAADELFMTQATVSRNIQSIEQALGIILFIRHKKRVHLTNAGKSLAKDLELVLRRTEKSVANALLRQENQFHSLRIGDMSCTYMEEYLLPIIREFEQRFPNAELLLERVETNTLLNNIHIRRYDAAFCINLGLAEQFSNEFDVIPLFDMEPCVVIANTNPLYTREEVMLSDLADQTLVTMRDGHFQYYQEFALAVCRENKIPIRRTRYVSNVFSIAMELKRDKTFAIMDRCFAPNGNDKLRFIPLDNCITKSGIALVVPKESSNPHLQEFISISKQFGHSFNTSNV